MMEPVVVIVIVGAAAAYLARKWWRAARDGGCGCGSCGKVDRSAGALEGRLGERKELIQLGGEGAVRKR